MLVIKLQYGVMICSINMKMIKYPYSNLKKPHQLYFNVVDLFFQSMFSEFNYEITLNDETFLVKFFDVCPRPTYNPIYIEPEFKIFKRNLDYELITENEIFNIIYNYLSDLTPYFDFEFYSYPLAFDTKNELDMPIKTFNLRKEFYHQESKRNIDLDYYWNC